MQFEAHRGVSTEFPENTMPAFIAAKEQGFHMIELDPMFTADGQCVTFHDKTVNRQCRTEDGGELPEPINGAELTYAQLLGYDAGLFKGEQFRGTRVPLLREVLSFAAKAGIAIKIDNRFADFVPWQREKMYEIVEQAGGEVGFTCKNPAITAEVVERFPNAHIHYDGPALEETLQEIKALLKNNPLTIWVALPCSLTHWVRVPKAEPEICAMVKKYGKLGIWILETEEQCRQAQALGADIIETTGSVKPR